MKNNNLKTQSHYLTRDIYLSAFLILNDVNLIKLHPKGNVVWFYFEKSSKVLELTSKYLQRNASKEPKTYNETIRNLRHMVRDALESG